MSHSSSANVINATLTIYIYISNNVSVICKRYYVEVVLKEIGILGDGSDTYETANKSKDEIIDDNRVYSERLGYSISEKELDLPTMYWIPKMHKNPIKHRFIVASKTCSTKQLSTQSY